MHIDAILVTNYMKPSLLKSSETISRKCLHEKNLQIVQHFEEIYKDHYSKPLPVTVTEELNAVTIADREESSGWTLREQ